MPSIFGTPGGVRILTFHNAVARAHGEYGKEADGKLVNELMAELAKELDKLEAVRELIPVYEELCANLESEMGNQELVKHLERLIHLVKKET